MPKPEAAKPEVEKKKGTTTDFEPELTIVGIGASAGGLQALKTFFENIPEKSGLAYVVVVHLSPEHKSILSELLQPFTSMPVQQVQQTIALKPDHVYVIPPGCNLDTIDTHLRLSELEEKRSKRAPIDHFFRTLAKTHDGNSIGIILTGTGSDGALGIKEIKGRNGIVIVQDPNEAEYDGMPQSAISTGLADMVLRVSEMPDQIIRLSKTKPNLPITDSVNQLEQNEQQLLHRIFAHIKSITGRDFSKYKISTIMRRMQRRMQLYQIVELKNYLELLRQNQDETQALSDDFLINVSNFFRDPEVFEQMEKEIIPALFKDKGPDDQVRVWSVGCATGEEAYSLAILLLEYVQDKPGAPKFQVFASDLHERSLKKAREGFYPGDIETDLSGKRLKRFFIKEDGGFRIRKEVREQVIFTPHNLLGDPPFSKLDLVVCRNLLIYLKRDVQKDVMGIFHYSLRGQGYLVLGTSENLETSELFRTENKECSIYLKRNITPPEPRLPVFPVTHSHKHHVKEHSAHEHEHGSFGMLHQQMVEQFAPPSILISGENKVLHISEKAGRYLIMPGGEPTKDFFSLIHKELRNELRNLLYSAKEGKQTLQSKPIPLKIDGETKSVIISVKVSEKHPDEKLALIVFKEQDKISKDEIDHQAEAREVKDSNTSAIELETELDFTQQRLQSIVEEYETSQEEMKAANEELQSSNEELRSTMEELETSKEELQSMNEELATVNQENRHKVEELSQLSSDLQNLMAATEIATLFLSKDFRILRFTPRLGELFNIRPADKGRPITDITNRLGYTQIKTDSKKVLDNLIPVEREVQDESGNWYLTRILPYRSTQDRIEGVVITFVDITSRKKSEDALRKSEEQFRALIEASAQMVWKTDAKGKVVEDSASWREYTGQSFEEWKGFGWINAIHPEDRELAKSNWQRSIEKEEQLESTFRVKHVSGEWRWTIVRAVPIRSKGGSINGWVGMNIDIHDQKIAEEALKKSEANLRESKDLLTLAREASNLGWGTWNYSTGKTEWDKRGQQILGLKDQENTYEDWIKHVHPEDRQRVEKQIKESAEHGKSFDIEYRVILPNDDIRYIHGTGAFTINDENAAITGTGHLRDITAHKLLQQQKDDFMRIASHELKTPVAVIKGYINMIEDLIREKGHDNEANLLVKVDLQINKIIQLINDLLDVSKIEAGQLKFEEREYDFDELVEEVVQDMQQISSHELKYEGRCGKTVVGDRNRTGQVMINLISNAIKYSPKNSTININCSLKDSEAVLSVTDKGTGISSNDVKHIFDRFYRVNETLHKATGLGLGLFISAEIIRRQGGKIWVESTKGKGSTFSFSLPVKG
ncbi:MAG: chemotaxis protein CheB [Candidatus Cyclobacteriaceae bacterium M2_1C_046]